MIIEKRERKRKFGEQIFDLKKAIKNTLFDSKFFFFFYIVESSFFIISMYMTHIQTEFIKFSIFARISKKKKAS
jgi:hypothetical protein